MRLRAVPALLGVLLLGAGLAGCKCPTIVKKQGGLGVQAMRPGTLEYYRGSQLIAAQSVPVSDTTWSEGWLIASQWHMPLRKSDTVKHLGDPLDKNALVERYGQNLISPKIWEMRTELTNAMDIPNPPHAAHRYGP